MALHPPYSLTSPPNSLTSFHPLHTMHGLAAPLPSPNSLCFPHPLPGRAPTVAPSPILSRTPQEQTSALLP
jgi:hypothetical protein